MGEIKKVKASIPEVTVDDYIFHNVSFQPTLINYFYGKNGTGKTTLAKAIGAMGANLPGITPEVFNDDFIRDNIQSYGNIPGVFTISETNAKIKKEIDETNRAKSNLEKAQQQDKDKAEALDAQLKKATIGAMDAVWKETAEFRKAYPQSLQGYLNNKSKFYQELIHYTPVEHSREECDRLYKQAHDKSLTACRKYEAIKAYQLPYISLLTSPIISTGNSTFAKLMKAWNTTDWVREGHERYHNVTEGKCPYCQRDLRADFESILADCFDAQYEESMKELRAFRDSYCDTLNRIYACMSNNLKIEFETVLTDKYRDMLELLREKGSANLTRIDRKIKSPTQPVELEELFELKTDIDNLATQINYLIEDQNEIVRKRDDAKRRCKKMVWEMMRQKTAAAQSAYDEKIAEFNGQLQTVKKSIEDADKQIYNYTTHVATLSKQTVNTTAAMEHMNALLKNAGFQGFYLREKPGAQYVYELVRTNKQVAKGYSLSEGERNFIAFLYFYHIVMGSQSDDGRVVDRIVVIDDPVSSMDSESLFTVATLVRNMISICFNNYQMSTKKNPDTHIKQIFCLTHNPYFFREISYNRIFENECVNLYEVKKGANNRSSITLCIKPDAHAGNNEVNFSPVKNSYDSLWHEYCHAEDSISLMSVCRRILEYYFLQMCGYDGGGIRTAILGDDDDVEFKSDDNRLMSAMIAFLDSSTIGLNDDLYFDASAVDPDHLRDTFRKIFETMNQEQHYQMMIGKASA